ncbi:MAG: DEAD/DEAH box helicase, partial [Aigarchaeota archaeon]|nr:DEAD/DEAH box helicase [Aigarchaeota archaeon]
MTSKGDSESERILRLLVKPVAEAFRERFGELIPPQIESIPQILEGRNLLLMSPTGTGKTEAAMLPILSSIMLEGRTPGVKLVYITPLRALNRDLLERIEWWSQKLDLTVSVRHGDTGAGERRMQALSPPDMLITTPETLQAILTGRVLRRHLKAVRWVIVDEIHELAMDKRGVQLSVGLERLVEIVGRRFQRVGLSATIGDPQRIASFLVGADEDCEIVRVPLGREMKLDVVFPRPAAKDRKLAEKLLTFPSVAARLSKIRE